MAATPRALRRRSSSTISRLHPPLRSSPRDDGSQGRNSRLSDGPAGAPPVGVRYSDGVLRRADRRADRRVEALAVSDRVGVLRARRGVLSEPRLSASLGVGELAGLSRHARDFGPAAVFWIRRRHGRLVLGVADNRRPPHWPAVGARENHGRAHAGAYAGPPA